MMDDDLSFEQLRALAEDNEREMLGKPRLGYREWKASQRKTTTFALSPEQQRAPVSFAAFQRVVDVMGNQIAALTHRVRQLEEKGK